MLSLGRWRVKERIGRIYLFLAALVIILCGAELDRATDCFGRGICGQNTPAQNIKNKGKLSVFFADLDGPGSEVA